jgi:alkanesulfonate monooxygenase SsuD/methylene tetrahydromethanopterin reductase-like flavin-dependent oxidoreductase (luciferase family)
MTQLIIGMDVSTSAACGDDPIAAAQLAEQLGYDFVSATDHPAGSHPSYDTLTLLTWIAASTSRIAIASRVLAVPFRRPAMVAKAATSLERLSGGRFILGLGGGHSDEEIQALGGTAPTPSDKIDGLAEAVEVIRGVWTHTPFSFNGRHHSVRELELQPKPAHPIPVWLGTFGVRALAVTGRLADGWIPSLGFAGPERIPAMRRRIDDAAHAAGRKPSDIRGIYNVGIRVDPAATQLPDLLTGSVNQILDQLHGYRELGFTGFNLVPSGPDRTDQMHRIAEDVVPGLRDACAPTSMEQSR